MDVETEVYPAVLLVQSKNEMDDADVVVQVEQSESPAKTEVEKVEGDSLDEGRPRVL
jgi:hypothetical protein